MNRVKLTIADVWELALVVLVVGAGAFLLSGSSGARTQTASERARQEACRVAQYSLDCRAPPLQEGRAAGRGALEGLDAQIPRR